jgi:hypothetical protein
MTTSSGLYRYHIGDLVRVVGYVGQAPIIEFLNRGEHICSLAGEKLTEHQVILAMKRAGQRTGVKFDSFILAPLWGSPPRYRLHAEAPPADGPAIPHDFVAELDRQLAEINLEYASRRHSQRLGPVDFNALPADYLARLDHEQAESHRRGNEQYKHRYLYSRPGEDARLPLKAKEPVEP